LQFENYFLGVLRHKFVPIFFILSFQFLSYFELPLLRTLGKPFKETNEIFSVMKMLPAGGTEVVRREHDKDVGGMRLRKINKKRGAKETEVGKESGIMGNISNEENVAIQTRDRIINI
jgi:hypothetical protein